MIFLVLRIYLNWQLSQKADKSLTKPEYGLVNGRFLVSLTGIFICLNAPVFLLFVFFRDVEPNAMFGFTAEDLHDNAREYACYLQDGSNLLPGDYFTIFTILGVLLVVFNRSKLVGARVDFAERCFRLGYLMPPVAREKRSGKSPRVVRIAFAQAAAGAWIPPLAKLCVEAATSAAVPPDAENNGGQQPPHVEVIALDNYGAAYCDQRDDQWLRLNLALDPHFDTCGRATLKVVKTDYFCLDLPSNSVDVFVVPIGAHMHAVTSFKGSKKQKQLFLEGILREALRVLRPGGHLLSSSAKVLGKQQEQWEEACEAVGFASVKQPEPDVASWIQCLPERLKLAFLPNPLGVGAGKRGWVAEPVYWNVFPAFIHVARKPLPDAAIAGADFIPPPDGQSEAEGDAEEDVEIPTAAPMTTVDKSSLSLAEREERDAFPPGRQFRLTEALVALNVLQWLTLVTLVWFEMKFLQVMAFLPFNKQVCSFFISITTATPIVVYINAEELREQAKTNGLLVPQAVLRNKIMRRWGLHRVNFFAMFAGLVLIWLPYFALDAFLIKYQGKSVDEVGDINVAVDVCIAVFFSLGIHKAAKWYWHVIQTSQERFDEEEQADMDRETTVAASATVSRLHPPNKPSEVSMSPVSSVGSAAEAVTTERV